MYPIKTVGTTTLLLALFALSAAAAPGQVRTPPIAQLALDVESGAATPGSLSGRIKAAFDAGLDGTWFAIPKDGLESTGPDDTIRLIRALKKRAASAESNDLAAYRRAWRELCRKIFELRVPPPPTLNSHVGQHLDYPTSTQEFAMVEMVTALLEASVDLWLRLDLGPPNALSHAMKSTAAAQAARDAAGTANDRLRLGDVAGAYSQIVGMCVDLMSSMNLVRG